MLVVKIEGIERILLESRFTKETCLPFSMSDFPQFKITSNVLRMSNKSNSFENDLLYFQKGPVLCKA